MARDKGNNTMICKHFARTKIKLPKGHKIEAECRECTLREEGTGDCLRDIYDVGDKLSEVSSEILARAHERANKVWEKFFERNHS